MVGGFCPLISPEEENAMEYIILYIISYFMEMEMQQKMYPIMSSKIHL